MVTWCEGEYIELDCFIETVWLFLFFIGLYLLSWEDVREKCRNVKLVGWFDRVWIWKSKYENTSKGTCPLHNWSYP